MDWLRSEDLKEEKGLTTSKLTITRQGSILLVPNRSCDGFGASFLPLPTYGGFRLKVGNAVDCLQSGQRERANPVAKEFIR